MIVKYEALNSAGATVTDTISVDDQSLVYGELTRRGLTPIRIEKGNDNSAKNSTGFKAALAKFASTSPAADPKKASKRHLPFFTSQMAILLKTGTPAATSLTVIEKQATCPHWKMLVGQLRQHVEDGGTLASAVDMYPNVFDPVYGSMISAGEMSGSLPDILNRLADFARQADRIRSKVVSAMIYPALLIIIAGAVMSVLVFFVLPRFGAIFEEMNVNLPLPTKILLSISDFVRSRILLTLAIVIGSISGLVFWLRSESGHRFRARTAVKLPIMGELVVSIINARIFRLLGLLLNSSVPLLQSLELTTRATDNYLYANLITKMHDNVVNGRPMYEIMIQSNLVPPSMAEMIHTGEDNGQIGEVMTLLADHLDDQNETKVATLTSIMEPLILIFMGGIIGTIAISLVLPMFDLSQIAG